MTVKDKCHAHLQEGTMASQPNLSPWKDDTAYAAGSHFQVHEGEGDQE